MKAGDAAICASDGQVAVWLAETERERVNAHADVGVLVLRRRGKASPGAWWAVVPADALARLLLRADDWWFEPGPPARLTLDGLALVLRRAGYGDPLVPVAGVDREAAPATG